MSSEKFGLDVFATSRSQRQAGAVHVRLQVIRERLEKVASPFGP